MSSASLERIVDTTEKYCQVDIFGERTREYKRKSRRMNKGLQMYLIDSILQKRGHDTSEIDIRARVDNTLTFSENYDIIISEYGWGDPDNIDQKYWWRKENERINGLMREDLTSEVERYFSTFGLMERIDIGVEDPEMKETIFWGYLDDLKDSSLRKFLKNPDYFLRHIEKQVEIRLKEDMGSEEDLNFIHRFFISMKSDSNPTHPEEDPDALEKEMERFRREMAYYKTPQGIEDLALRWEELEFKYQ